MRFFKKIAQHTLRVSLQSGQEAGAEDRAHRLEKYDSGASEARICGDAADLLSTSFPVVLQEDGGVFAPLATGAVIHCRKKR